MPFIYMVPLKYFLCDLSSLTTLPLYSVSFCLIASPVLQSSHLTWADFMDSSVSANSKHKSTPKNPNYFIYYCICQIHSLISPGIPQNVTNHRLAKIIEYSQHICQLLQKVSSGGCGGGEEGKESKNGNFFPCLASSFLRGVKLEPGSTLKLLRVLMRSLHSTL